LKSDAVEAVDRCMGSGPMQRGWQWAAAKNMGMSAAALAMHSMRVRRTFDTMNA
jgi:hypothetical protein